MATHQVHGGFPHPRQIQSSPHEPREMAGKRGSQLPIPDPVLVDLSPGAKSRVEGLANLLNIVDPDILGEEAIEGSSKCPGIKLAMGLEIDDLSQGVNSRIGSARGNQSHPFPRDLRQLLLHDSLNSPHIGLNLPAVIRSSIIFDGQFYASHPLPIRTEDGGRQTALEDRARARFSCP